MAVVESCDLPWTIELRKRHWQLKIAGRPVSVFSKGPFKESKDIMRCDMNSATNARRVIREIKEGAT